MTEAATALLPSIQNQREPFLIYGVSSNETQPLPVEVDATDEPIRQYSETSTDGNVDCDTINWQGPQNDFLEQRPAPRHWQQWVQEISPGERFFQYLVEIQFSIDFDAEGLKDAQLTSEVLLRGILDDLWSLPAEAIDEGIPVPSKKLLESVERLLKEMFDILPWQFEVYATADAAVDIDVPNLRGSSVIVTCDKAGGALCTVHIRGDYKTQEYEKVDLLPDDFLTESLKELVN